MSSMYSLIIILTIVFKLVSVTQEREQGIYKYNMYISSTRFPYASCHACMMFYRESNYI